MRNKSSYSKPATGMKNIPDRPVESKNALAFVLGNILQTREARQLLITLLPGFLEGWSGSNRVKQLFSKIINPMVDKQLSKPDDIFNNNEIQALFKDEAFVKKFTSLLPEMVNTFGDALSDTGICLEKASADTQKEFLKNLMSGTGRARSGKLLTSLAKILTGIHQTDPAFFAATIEPVFKKWIESVDFAEIKESVDGSSKDVMALTKMVNNTMWQYPSKIISLMSLLPSFVNLVTGSLNISIERFNALPPDLLTDIITAMLMEIKEEEIATLLNELTEISRKINVGSALLGEPGLPHLETALTIKIEAIVSKMDPKLFWKGKIALARLKAAVDDAMAEAVSNDPEFLKLSMINGPELSNIRLRSKNRNLAFLETLDEEELETVLQSKLLAVDTEEAAEWVNGLTSVVNRLWDQNPAIFTKFARQFLNSLDQDELAFTVTHLFEEIGEDLKPVARTFVPGLVEWVCDVLAPADDEYEEHAQRARNALGSLLMPKEVQKK